MKTNFKIRIPQFLLMALAIATIIVSFIYLFYAVGYCKSGPSQFPVGTAIDYAIFFTCSPIAFGSASGAIVLTIMSYRNRHLLLDAILIGVNIIIDLLAISAIVAFYLL